MRNVVRALRAQNATRFIVTLALSVATLFLGVPLAAAAGPTVLVAHRGVGTSTQVKYGFPELSLPAFDWAVENDADIVDMDAQVTSDNQLVVMHDATLNRTTNCTGEVRKRTLPYIKKCWMELPIDRNGNGDPDNTPYHPPSVSQALDLLKNLDGPDGQPIKIDIELKGSYWTQSTVNFLRDKLKSRGMLTQQVNVHAFSFTRAQYIVNAGIPNRGYAVPTAGPLPSVATAKKYGGNIFIQYGLGTASTANKLQVQAYSKNGLKVWIFTMDRNSEYDEALELGDVYAWQVDDLLTAQDYLEGAG
jgi:glycerophosphoryl diester phosphodiesterase